MGSTRDARAAGSQHATSAATMNGIGINRNASGSNAPMSVTTHERTAMDEGYRVSWQTTLGGSPPGIVYKNDRKWSADHGGYDYQITSGIFVTNQKIATADPRIIDIAPTVLKFFGLSIPSDIDGKPLF